MLYSQDLESLRSRTLELVQNLRDTLLHSKGAEYLDELQSYALLFINSAESFCREADQLNLDQCLTQERGLKGRPIG
jgi:hypothetical protein